MSYFKIVSSLVLVYRYKQLMFICNCFSRSQEHSTEVGRKRPENGQIKFCPDVTQHAAMVNKAPLKIYARGVVSYFYFSRAPRTRARRKSGKLKVPFQKFPMVHGSVGHGFLPWNSSHGTSDVYNGFNRHREPKYRNR
jgi:hypothetical protein